MSCVGQRGFGDTAIGVLLRFDSGDAWSSHVRVGPSIRTGEEGGEPQWIANVTGETYFDLILDFGVQASIRLWVRGEPIDIPCPIAG